MSQALNRYKADLRDFQFLLFEQFRVQDLLKDERYAEWDEAQIRLVLDEAYRFVREVVGPLNAVGDRLGCTLENGRVKAPPGFKEAWQKLYEAGWKGIGSESDRGGMGAPLPLQGCVEEMLCGANNSFSMYPGLTHAAAEVIAEFGTEQQRTRYAVPMFKGAWGGTMCITEAHAGSDVGAASTSAKKCPDGTYLIRGTKIFISGGDHDLTENIVHLVLARIEGARSGTKGLSLFIVPRVRVAPSGQLEQDNDVEVAGIEHKMGIHGSATCALNFGDNEQCVGELLGTVEHQGIAQMFKMMNTARIGVGIQGLSAAAGAYAYAVDYAKERKQGSSIQNFKDPDAPRLAIIEHADVKRMLLEMKARVEGVRALAMKLTSHADWAKSLRGKDDSKVEYHLGQVELLVPLLKSYASDTGFEVSSLAIQVLGGAGFLYDHPVEQCCRDARILSIYEGTNHIQALDLVARKLSQSQGAHARAFFGDVQAFASKHRQHPTLAAAVAQLESASEAVAGSALKLMTFSAQGKLERVPLVANRFLTMMAELTLGFLLLEQAVIACERMPAAGESDKAFYAGKQHSAVFFANNILPHVKHLSAVIALEDASALEIKSDSFISG